MQMSDNSNLEVHEADSNGGETDLPGFDSFNLNPAILRGVAEAGFQTPSPIQEQAIPVILAGHDMVGQAHTGTGKTAAVGLPRLNYL
jgi:ATP-dependent RNA helicase DeaD